MKAASTAACNCNVSLFVICTQNSGRVGVEGAGSMDQNVEAPPTAVPILPEKNAAAPLAETVNSTVIGSNGSKVPSVLSVPTRLSTCRSAR